LKGGESLETKCVEYKSEITNAFLKTVSAYANYMDGVIIFGIDDDGNIVGIDDAKSTALDIENKINDCIRPVPKFELTINSSNRTITLSVFEGNGKPYLYKNKAYKRSDTSSVEVDRTEFNRLILEGSNQSFESLPSSNTELSFELLEQKLIDELQINGINKDILKTLNLFSEKTGYNIAAELLSDHNSFPGIDIIRFGDNINEILDREIFEDMSILQQYDLSLKMFNKYYSSEIIDGVKRKKQFSIPENAFREALANALVHRTWDVKSAILISMHRDRIEIASSGGLPFGLSKEEYLSGQISILRNPIIGNVFFRLKYIEMFGTGIRRINYSYAENIIKPEFKIFENSIKLVLPLVQENFDFLTNDEQIVFHVLSDGLSKSRIEIEEKTKFNKDKLIRVLNQLIDKNAIEKSGTGRGTKYNRL
jgi:ATP-dependent DNA helicase RecG